MLDVEMNSSLLYNLKKGVATKKRSIYIKFIMLKNANVFYSKLDLNLIDMKII